MDSYKNYCTTLVAELLQDVRLDGNVTGLRDVIGEVMGKVMVINDTMFNVYYQDVKIFSSITGK